MEMSKIKCNGCGEEIDCQASTVKADKHFCATCCDLMAMGVDEKDLKGVSKFVIPEKNMIECYEKCDEIAKEMLDLTFWGFWERTKRVGLENFTEEQLAKEFYVHGASSALGFLMSMAFDLDFLDEIKFTLKDVKRLPEMKTFIKNIKKTKNVKQNEAVER